MMMDLVVAGERERERMNLFPSSNNSLLSLSFLLFLREWHRRAARAAHANILQKFTLHLPHLGEKFEAFDEFLE